MEPYTLDKLPKATYRVVKVLLKGNKPVNYKVLEEQPPMTTYVIQANAQNGNCIFYSTKEVYIITNTKAAI